VQKGLALYNEPELLSHFRQNAMAADFSWDRTAAQFVKVYERVANTEAEECKTAAVH